MRCGRRAGLGLGLGARHRQVLAVRGRLCSSSAPAAGDDPFTALFPRLASLPPDRLKVVAGHFHLILEDGFAPGEHTWNFGSSFEDNVFDALGHKWLVDFELTRNAAIDVSTVGGGTFRRFTLQRLTRGHPLPIKAVCTLEDAAGGAREVTAEFYSPLQQEEGLIEERFELLRVSEADADVQDGAIDPENLSSIAVTLSLAPEAVPVLVNEMFDHATQTAP
ncbi:hypothetical protein DIPPA_05270 [Diplonema papillatum]|nr:hypothetical protein DIPPA_05270 [Diplonema papillatum]